MLRLSGLALLALLVAAAAVSWRERARVARLTDAVAARRELTATQLAPAGTAPQAGISAMMSTDVPAIPDALARSLRNDPDFLRLVHRCGVCHATPDPALYPAAGWEVVVERMAGTIEVAGLLPLTAADSAAIMRVLTGRPEDRGARATPRAPPPPARR